MRGSTHTWPSVRDGLRCVTVVADDEEDGGSI